MNLRLKVGELDALGSVREGGRYWRSTMISLTRRQFGLAAMAASVGGASASAQPGAPTVRLPDGSLVPALGQGSAGLAGGRHPASQEEEALRTGISARMTPPSPAAPYGNAQTPQRSG